MATESFTETKMKALEWRGNRSMKIAERDVPHILESTDAIIRITSTAICGSDLHLFHKEFSGLSKGDILGHEFMGVVQEVGAGVKHIKPGNRVVCSFNVSCGTCDFCVNGLTSSCDRTNDSKMMKESYGHCISGMFGYTSLTGKYDGGQAELVRVPFADTVCLKLPSMDHFPDEKFLFLSDVMATSFHATECGGVCPGQTVGVWGLGPIGIMTAAWCKFRGASRVIGIDNDPFRLEFARSKLQIEVINFDEQDVIKTLHEWVPSGLDVAVDAVGFRFPHTFVHKMQRALRLETDCPEVIVQAIMCLRKAGNLSIVGDYYQLANNFPIGALMEKGISVRGGQCPVARYWHYLLDLIVSGQFDPSFIITHIWPFERADEAYDMFDKHKDNCLKVVLKTAFGTQLAHQHRWTVEQPSFSSIHVAPLQTDPPVYINPTVVGTIPYRNFPHAVLSSDQLPYGEKTRLTASLHMPINQKFSMGPVPVASAAHVASAFGATGLEEESGEPNQDQLRRIGAQAPAAVDNKLQPGISQAWGAEHPVPTESSRSSVRGSSSAERHHETLLQRLSVQKPSDTGKLQQAGISQLSDAPRGEEALQLHHIKERSELAREKDPTLM